MQRLIARKSHEAQAGSNIELSASTMPSYSATKAIIALERLSKMEQDAWAPHVSGHAAAGGSSQRCYISLHDSGVRSAPSLEVVSDVAVGRRASGTEYQLGSISPEVSSPTHHSPYGSREQARANMYAIALPGPACRTCWRGTIDATI
jgi:hypothetical protein